MMAKSKALPFMESPAHLDGMVGNVGFDPMGLSTPQNIKWMREAELKHGRMAMLAWTVRRDTAEHCAPQAARAWPWPAPQRTAQYLGVARREELRLRNTRPTRGSRLSSNRCPLAAQGYVAVDLGIKFPGEKYAALTSYTAHAATAQQELFYALLFVGTAETIGFTQIYNMMDGEDDRAPGDFGFDPLKLLPGNEEQYKLAELTHGRAGMLAFSAVITQSAMHDAFGTGSETFPYF